MEGCAVRGAAMMLDFCGPCGSSSGRSSSSDFNRRRTGLGGGASGPDEPLAWWKKQNLAYWKESRFYRNYFLFTQILCWYLCHKDVQSWLKLRSSRLLDRHSLRFLKGRRPLTSCPPEDNKKKTNKSVSTTRGGQVFKILKCDPGSTHLSRLRVLVHLRQAGGLLRGSQGLKLAEVCEVGLLRNLLGGGGGGECSSAHRNTLSLDTMPRERYGCLQAEEHSWTGKSKGILNCFLFVFFFLGGGYLCGQRSRGHRGRESGGGGLGLSGCRCGSEVAVHVQRRRARVGGLGAGRRGRRSYHL